MRFIPTQVHGLVDYLTAAVLVAAPWAGGFATGGPEQWVPVVFGLLVAGQSLLTDYEWGAARVIPVPAHLAADAGLGVLLAASPWLFGFADRVTGPHVAVGGMEIALALFTQTAAGVAGGGAAARRLGRAVSRRASAAAVLSPSGGKTTCRCRTG